MAFTVTPSTWLAGWTEDGTNITLPIANLPELTAAEADASSGDIRKIIYALCEKFHAVNAAIETANKSTKMTISRSVSYGTDDIITKQYTFTFKVAATAADVVAE
jgi:hypothetical protein